MGACAVEGRCWFSDPVRKGGWKHIEPTPGAMENSYIFSHLGVRVDFLGFIFYRFSVLFISPGCYFLF